MGMALEIFSRVSDQKKIKKLNDFSLLYKPYRMNHLLCKSMLALCRSKLMIEGMQTSQLKSQVLMLRLYMKQVPI